MSGDSSLGIGIGLALKSYGRGFRGLLNQYPGAAAAYSLRKLSRAASNVVRVRRSSDNDEKDFTALQVSSGEMVNWVTDGNPTADGFVETWYDQSGNGNDAVQATTTAQPKIVASGALVAGGLDFDGVDDVLNTGLVLTGSFNITAYANVSAGSGRRILFGARDSTDERAYLAANALEAVSAGVGDLTDDNLQSVIAFQNAAGSVDVDGTTSKIYATGSLRVTDTNQSVENTTHGASIGGLNSAGINIVFWGGTCEAIIAYNTSQSAITPALQVALAELYA